MINHRFGKDKTAAQMFAISAFIGLWVISLHGASAQQAYSPEGPVTVTRPIPTPWGGCEEWGVSIKRYTRAKDSITWNLGNLPECLHTKLKEMWKSCIRKDYPGDCMLAKFLGIDYQCYKCPGLTYDWDGLSDKLRYFYFAYDCSTHLPREGAAGEIPKECFSAFVTAASPISLLIGIERENSEDLVFTRFPLDPHRAGGVYTWKASAQAPLLVYDPSHNGEITSAHQLFGQWTFGGRKTAFYSAAQIACDFGSSLPTPWRDGFAAMSSMDADQDGKLSGSELEPLGLWFDYNRDGISQRGEVRTLAAEGISALYFEPDYTDPKTKSIYVKRGYDRQINGKTVSGVAVDWYARAADSIHTLLMDRLLNEKWEAVGYPVERPTATALGGGPAGSFSGVWLWTEIGAVGKSASGALVLSDREGEDRIKGASVLELPFNAAYQKKVGARSMMAVLMFDGKKGLNPDGTRSIEFKIASGSGSSTFTRAVLSKDGQTLSGQSSLSTISDGGRKVDYTYRWRASRMR